MKQNTKMPTSRHRSFNTISRFVAIASCLLSLLLSAQGKTISRAADTTSTDAQAARSNLDTQRKGKDFPLKTTIATASVRQNVTVEAVLLPYDVCKRVFGTEIAKNYAAVELTVSNRSPDSALIVQSVFIDYRDWALSGINFLDSTRTGEKKSDGGTDWPDYDAPNKAGQISSVEYRVARGELLDRQPWTFRNLSLRALQAAGSIAAAYTFSISEKGIITGIGAFNGEVMPALNALFPDGTVGQMNRISDLGFQVNKVIPKNSSDIVVAFFPLDRFLTPGLKKLFLKSPALFFAPYALMFDKEARNALRPQIEYLLGDRTQAELFMTQLSVGYINAYVSNLDVQPNTDTSSGTGQKGCQVSDAKLPLPDKIVTKKTKSSSPSSTPDQGNAPNSQAQQGCATALTQARAVRVMQFLSHASLNTIHVVMGGDMVVDVDTIPAQIADVKMDEGNDQAKTWKAGDHTGVITGKYLSGTEVSILLAEAADIGNPVFTVDKTKSTDTSLYFSVNFPADVKADQLTFRVAKTSKSGDKVQSTPFVIKTGQETPHLDQPTVSGTTLSIIGSGFADPMTVYLFKAGTATSDVTKADKTVDKTTGLTIASPTQADIDLSKAGIDLTKDTGCWSVRIKVGDLMVTNVQMFPQTACKKAK